MIDGLSDAVKERNSMSRWLTQMERLGFPVMVIPAREAPAFFAQTVSGMKRDEDCCHYIFGMGMDRCTSMADDFYVEVEEDDGLRG